MSKRRLAVGIVVVCALAATAVLLTHDHRAPAAHSAGTGGSGPATGAPTHAVSALATFGGKEAGLSFTYPSGWYVGGEEDENGPIGGSAGPDELITYVSDRPFEPLCSTTHDADGGTSSGCQTPPVTDVWVEWMSPNGMVDLGLDRRYAHATKVDGDQAWIYEGRPHQDCAWRPTTYEIAVGIPDDPTNPGGAGIAVTACLSGSNVTGNLAAVHRMIDSLQVPATHASSPPSALAMCRRSSPSTVRSAGLVTVGWIRAYPTSVHLPGSVMPAHAFASAPDSDRAAWCWIDRHRYRWELQTVTMNDPNGPLLAISNAKNRPPPPIANATVMRPFALALCRQVLSKPVYSAKLVTVGWVRAYRPGGPPGTGASAAHAFPVARSADAAAWCWTGSPGDWTFSAVDVDNETFIFGSVSGVGLAKPPMGPLTEK